MQIGTWGGDHIGLEVFEGGAKVEYDCAHGTVEGALRLDAEGKFTAEGLHIRERVGPQREKPEGEPEKARYWGQVTGNRMVLTVLLPETQEKIGTFKLAFGQSPRIRKCQ